MRMCGTDRVSRGSRCGELTAGRESSIIAGVKMKIRYHLQLIGMKGAQFEGEMTHGTPFSGCDWESPQAFGDFNVGENVEVRAPQTEEPLDYGKIQGIVRAHLFDENSGTLTHFTKLYVPED